MKYPLFATEDDDICCFENAKSASMYLEAIDVINEVSISYDAEGRLLKLSAENKYDTVKIALAEETPTHADELKAKLIHSIEYLYEIGKIDDIDWLLHADLNQIVEEFAKTFGYE